MADFPLKVIPPKYRDIGKAIKVRVFNVDPKTRNLEFTRKDTLMKSKVPVYQSYKEVSKGTKLYGVIVSENEYGYIIKTFGGIKCFLTF
jgi:ribosomal protein S1